MRSLRLFESHSQALPDNETKAHMARCFHMEAELASRSGEPCKGTTPHLKAVEIDGLFRLLTGSLTPIGMKDAGLARCQVPT